MRSQRMHVLLALVTALLGVFGTLTMLGSWSGEPVSAAAYSLTSRGAEDSFMTPQLAEVMLGRAEVAGTLETNHVSGVNVAGDITGTYTITVYLPLVAKRWPPIPYAPVLNPIGNLDHDSYYAVTWQSSPLAAQYVLEQATNPSFATPEEMYVGPNLSWTVPNPGQTPSKYFYRVKALNQWGQSSWSTVQQVEIYPLFVGLQARWDGVGYIRADEWFDVGSHHERFYDGMTDADAIRCRNHQWYDPNPKGWDESYWDTYYSVSTGYFLASSVPGDPAWKWGTYWVMPYDVTFQSGQIMIIGGQAFDVSGPHSGYTTFGKAVQYWRLVNRDAILYWDGGIDWQLYVRPGDLTLWYDAGNTRLLLHEDIVRTDYYLGDPTPYTVQYITNLTASNSFPSSSPEEQVADIRRSYLVPQGGNNMTVPDALSREKEIELAAPVEMFFEIRYQY